MARPRRGKPLGGRELRRLREKSRRGRYIAVTSTSTVGGFAADVAAVPGFALGGRRKERAA